MAPPAQPRARPERAVTVFPGPGGGCGEARSPRILRAVPRERLGELLLRSGVLTQAQLVAALRDHARTGVRLGQILVDHGMVEEATLYDALSKMTGLERFNLRTAILERTALGFVTAEWAAEHGVVPFKVDSAQRVLQAAVLDPTNLKPIDELAFRSGMRVKMLVASETELQRIVRHHFHGEPLDRDARNVRRPDGRRKTSDIEPESIILGMDVLRDEIQKQHFEGEPPSAPAATAIVDDPDRSALLVLKPIFDAQEEAARTLRAIFELCVSRGVIGREEYFERLSRAQD